MRVTWILAIPLAASVACIPADPEAGDDDPAPAGVSGGAGVDSGAALDDCHDSVPDVSDFVAVCACSEVTVSWEGVDLEGQAQRLVVAYVEGPVEDVVSAWCEGTLSGADVVASDVLESWEEDEFAGTSATFDLSDRIGLVGQIDLSDYGHETAGRAFFHVDPGSDNDDLTMFSR